jgi:Flp pilus assembly protein TadG
MALVLPLFLTLVLGHLESTRLGMTSQLLNASARDASRLAVLNGTTSNTAVLGRINASLVGSGIKFTTLTTYSSAVPLDPGAYISPPNWATSPNGTPITVLLRVRFSDVSWVPTPMFLKTARITASITMASERP